MHIDAYMHIYMYDVHCTCRKSTAYICITRVRTRTHVLAYITPTITSIRMKTILMSGGKSTSKSYTLGITRVNL